MSKVILTVDDSANVRQMVAFTLRNAGYEVLEAIDGADALTKLNGTIHMAISDVNMPRMDGIEFIRNVRANAAYKYIPIVFLTLNRKPRRNRKPKRREQPAGLSNPSSRNSCWLSSSASSAESSPALSVGICMLNLHVSVRGFADHRELPSGFNSSLPHR